MQSQYQHKHEWVPMDCALLTLDGEEWVAMRFVCTCEECNAVKVVVEKLQDVGKVMDVGKEIEKERKPVTLEDVKKMFPTDLEPFFNFEDKGEYIKVTPRQYLGSQNFATAAQIVRFQLRGDYVSAGKDSHFRIPKK